MNKNLIQSVKIIVLSVIIGLGVSFVLAGWTAPSGVPVENTNASGPINVGSNNQVKEGGFAVGVTSWPKYNNVDSPAKLEVEGIASLKALAVWNKAYLVGDVTIGLNPGGGTNPLGYKENNLFAKLNGFLGLDNLLKTEKVVAAGPVDPGGGNSGLNPYPLCVTDIDCGGHPWKCVAGTCIYPVQPSSVGVCGGAKGQTFSVAPTTNLCEKGTPSIPTGSGESNGFWKWNCNDDAPVGCSANLTYPDYLLTVYGNSKIGGALSVSGHITSQNKNVCLETGEHCPSAASVGSLSDGYIPIYDKNESSFRNSLITKSSDGSGLIVKGNFSVGVGHTASAPALQITNTINIPTTCSADTLGQLQMCRVEAGEDNNYPYDYTTLCVCVYDSHQPNHHYFLPLRIGN